MSDVSATTSAAMPIDPRLRARRIAVRRDAGRRRLRRVLAIAGTVGLVAAGWGTSRSPVLDVDHLRVAGARHTATAAIRAAVGVPAGTPLMDVDLAAAEARVERLPWVAKATVGRQWPGTLSIRVTERAAAARAPGAGGRWVLIDASGRVLALAKEPPAAGARPLVRIEGIAPAGVPGSSVAPAAQPALEVAQALRGPVARAVASITVFGPDVGLVLVDGGVVRLGSIDDLGAKLLAVRTVLEQVDTAGLAMLDVRVPGAPVIRRTV